MIWLPAVPAVLGLSLTLNALGLPAATLFAAVLVGLAIAVSRRTSRAPVTMPRPAIVLSQACLGVVIGALVQPDIVLELSRTWVPVLGAVVCTVVISLAAGLVFSLHRDVDRVTGSFALVAGGAAGITGISRDVGADQQVVAVVQYLRVLVIVVTMPALAALLTADSTSVVAAAQTSWSTPATGGVVRGAAFTLVCAALGLGGARLVHLPAGSLLGPMLVATALTATDVSRGLMVPPVLEHAAFAAIGLQVGLSFTRRSLRTVRAVLPMALALIVVMTAATAAVGIPLLRLTGSSVLDAYLATTPGGLYAVLATAADVQADTTVVATVQVLRLFVMLLMAPLLAALLSRRRGRPDAQPK